MFLVIYSSENSYFPKYLSTLFVYFDIALLLKQERPGHYLFETNREEFVLDFITEQLESLALTNISAIIIDKRLGVAGWERATGLAGHIALSQFEKSKLNDKPIVLTDWSPINIEDSSLKYGVIANLFQTHGIYFRTYDQLFSPLYDHILNVERFRVEQESKDYHKLSYEEFIFSKVSDSSHQSTNEWGAIRLAIAFGYRVQDLTFQWPRHLYFKFLIKSLQPNVQVQSIDNSLSGLFSKVLLIDDNAINGWAEVISKILDCSLDYAHREQEFVQLELPQGCDNYDLVLLDLYLDRESRTIDRAVGILNSIKMHNPQIPVVVVTASNKSWNLREVQESGADGMFSKESPDLWMDNTSLQNNKANFSSLILSVYNKYKVVGPYWRAIQTIKRNPNFLAITNSSNHMMRDRISERLLMFIGLLKKGFEQSKYDQNTYHYSDYELAFITLWSVLNEIQEAYFLKTQPNVVPGNNPSGLSVHPNGQPIAYQNSSYTKHHKWECSGQVFCEYEYSLDYSQNGAVVIDQASNMFKLKGKRKSSFKYVPGATRTFVQLPQAATIKVNYEQLLFMQIGFLLVTKFGTGLSDTDPYIKSLLDLNDVRNHVYLTHGDLSSVGYYSDVEKLKRSSPNYQFSPTNEIKKLFELVNFLLTGTSINIMF